MKQKYLLLSMALFFFLILFSTTSFALIPGDFGSADNGPPDGCVDFEDLMIFAMAYGSTPSDPNWNPICDIAGPSGSLIPDGTIDFEDLMIFAMHYGECEKAAWTVMVYMDGDNNLENSAWNDLSEMESVGSKNNVNMLVQLDPYNDSKTYRYYVTGTEEGFVSPYYPSDIVETLPEQNMADPATLANFVNWATSNYSAENYLLVLWDHGGGWRDRNILTKGVIWDDTDEDYMTMAELAQGLMLVNEHIDIIGFDACLMQMIEVAYEIVTGLTDPPNYMVGSQELEWGDGWPYNDILNHLTDNPAMNEATLCETIVNDYINYCGSPATLSALYINNEVAGGVLDTINSFANALINSSQQSEIATARSTAQSYTYYPEYKDLYDFAQIIYNNVPDCQTQAQAIIDLVNTMVIAEAHIGEVENSHGLSIFLPDNSSGYDSNYDSLRFTVDTQWDDFLKSSGVVPPSSVYRAFLVGVGDYQHFPDAYGNTDLPAPPYDVNMLYDTLSHSGSGFSLITELIDLQATKAAILNGIATAFSGADEDDISYFYFDGHGINYEGISYLCPTDVMYNSPLSAFISTAELEAALSAIPGTKVVILDCCHSGGFISKEIQEEEIFSNPQEFNNGVINIFLSKDLTGSQYKVLTSCLSSQVCVELIPSEGDPFGLFSSVLCEGCGYNYYTHPYFADGNENGEITLHEAYTYTYEQVNIIATELNNLYGWNIDQDTQVYPLNSDFIIIEE